MVIAERNGERIILYDLKLRIVTKGNKDYSVLNCQGENYNTLNK